MRYVILLVLNIPVILLALINIVTQYKMKKISSRRFKRQLLLWIAILATIAGSFPVYNSLSGQPPLDSSELSVFDILQTTLLVGLIYVANYQRQKIEKNERLLRDLHQELSIILSRNT